MSKPNQFPWINPYLAVSDVEKSIHFYENAFGFTLHEKADNDKGKAFHAEMNYHDGMIMMGDVTAYQDGTKTPKMSETACPIVLCVYVNNVDQFYEHALANGAESVKPPADEPWGDRMCNVKDIDGYTWAFATHQPPSK